MKMTVTKIAAVAALAVVVITGCDLLLGLESVDAQGRIDAFQTALNSDNPDGLQGNFHPTETAQYDQMNDAATYFGGSPLAAANQQFSLSVTITDNLDGTYTATGTITNGFSATFNATIELADYGIDDVRIATFQIDDDDGVAPFDFEILTLP